MCLIISSLPNAPRETKENLEAAQKINSDGTGVAFNHENKLIVQRGFADFESFHKYYLEIPADSTIVTHFRKSSSGLVCDENLHPFVVHENLCFAFNGTIASLNNPDDPNSDTFNLNETIIKPLVESDGGIHETIYFKALIESFIGCAKMVMLDNNGRLTFFNESKGSWNTDKNTWYSNLLWKTFDKKKKHNAADYVSKPLRTSAEIAADRGKYGQLNLHLPNLGSIATLKKKYYRTGDPYYQELSPSELEFLAKKNNCGLKKLHKRKKLISLLEDVSDERRLAGRFLQFRDEAVKKKLQESAAMTFLLENKKEEAAAIKNICLPDEILKVSIGDVLGGQLSKVSTK